MFGSKIERDEDRPDYYWGKYLFLFQNNEDSYRPIFDKHINYKKDKGHLLHFISDKTDNEEYIVILSVRNFIGNNNYNYLLYSSCTKNFKYFYNTHLVEVDNKISDSIWYCYPEIFRVENGYKILLNQDDFGKEKNTLLGDIIF